MSGREVHAWAAIDVDIRELLAIKAACSSSSVDALLFLGRELEVLGDGTQSKSYLHVDGRANAMLVAVEGSRDRVSIYNAGSEDRISVLDVARIVIEEMGLRNTRIRLVGGRRIGEGTDRGRQGHVAGRLEN